MKSDFKKMMCLISSITVLSFVAAERTFASPGSSLDSLKSEIQRRIDELNECHSLTRIPEILGDFCKSNDSEDLTQISNYVSEFTSRFIESRLGKEDQKNQASRVENGTCSLCMDQIGSDDHTAQLGCGHSYHSECLQPMVDTRLRHEEPEALRTCPQPGCGYQISGSELASLGCSSHQVLAIQRMLVRSVKGLKFCPHCGLGMAKHNELLGFGYHCQNCDRDLCFSCGKPPHHDISCEELNSDEGVKKAFIRELLKTGRSDDYGLCPNPKCRALIEKKDGCNSITCGKNASDKNQIPGTLEGRGCGQQFDWANRIRLEKAFIASNEASSSGSQARVNTQTQELDVPVVAQAPYPGEVENQTNPGPDLTIIQPNDPRVQNFPQFAALGPMVQIGNLLWSGVAPNTRNHRDAIRFCEDLDSPERRWHERRQAGEARLPTREEYEDLRTVMGYPNHYNPNLIPGMNNRAFWSSSLIDNYYAYSFGGYNGSVGSDARYYYYYSVRCVRAVAW